MGTVIVTVVVTLGIIIAGGFLIYFLGDLFMSIASHGKKDDEIIKNKSKRDQKLIQKALEEKYPEDADKIKNDPEYATVVLSGGKVESYDPDEQVKAEEAKEPETEEIFEEKEEPVEEESNAEETIQSEESSEDSEAERIAKRRQEILDRINRIAQNMEENDDEESEEEVDMTEENEKSEENVENEDENKEENAQEVEETTEETTAEDSNEETAEETVEETVEENAQEENTDDVSVVGYSVEELEEIIAKEKEELKANEKEFRKCKKEFIPLRRVKRTLESDEKKLHRREALVAKQQVELYGVNNIQDIDEEKAKKLSEDLDLLDGLKLSVQHCQEVMSKNAERYPLLEKIFDLLSSKNAELKNSIANHEDMLAKLKDQTGEGQE